MLFTIIALLKSIVLGIMVIFAIELGVQTFRIDRMNEKKEYELFHFENEGSYKKDVKRINALM